MTLDKFAPGLREHTLAVILGNLLSLCLPHKMQRHSLDQVRWAKVGEEGAEAGF